MAEKIQKNEKRLAEVYDKDLRSNFMERALFFALENRRQNRVVFWDVEVESCFSEGLFFTLSEEKGEMNFADVQHWSYRWNSGESLAEVLRQHPSEVWESFIWGRHYAYRQ